MEFVDAITKYWTIVVFIGGIIISWARYESKNKEQDKSIADIEKRLAYTETKLEAHTQLTNNINNDIAIIKTTLEYIKQAIEELKDLRKK